MEIATQEYEYRKIDFDNPSILFILEDVLKSLIGGPLFYTPYYRKFGLKGNEIVLDFGCGGGAGSKSLLRFISDSGKLILLDVSGYWINKAKKRLQKYSNVGFIAGDIRKLNIGENLFDVISILHVIHDIEPGERQSIVNSLCSKLKKRGTIFIREPIKQSHGMPFEEIRALFLNNDLTESQYEVNRSEYSGRWEK